MSDKTAAAYHGSGPCKKGCCWTPYRCALDWTCEHHRDAAIKEARKDWQADAVSDLERAGRTVPKPGRRP